MMNVVKNPTSVGAKNLYLSRLTVSPKARSLHRLVMRGFPATDSASPRQTFGVLFRSEPDGSVLVQSHIEPDWALVCPDYQVREFSLGFHNGDRLFFRTTINPVIRRSGREIGTLSGADWLSRRDIGADVTVVNESVVSESDYSYRPDRKRDIVPLTMATIEGFMTVRDADRLKSIIVNGLGRSRSYGCGLVSVRHIVV